MVGPSSASTAHQSSSAGNVPASFLFRTLRHCQRSTSGSGCVDRKPLTSPRASASSIWSSAFSIVHFPPRASSASDTGTSAPCSFRYGRGSLVVLSGAPGDQDQRVIRCGTNRDSNPQPVSCRWEQPLANCRFTGPPVLFPSWTLRTRLRTLNVARAARGMRANSLKTTRNFISSGDRQHPSTRRSAHAGSRI